MKNIIKSTLLLVTLAIVSCESKQDVQSDIDKLRNERTALQSEVAGLSATSETKKNEIASLDEKLKERKIYLDGKTPKYILKIHLRQTHISFSIKEHIKDAMNAIDFEMPVDRDFYNSVTVGTNIVDNFRVGSLIMRGSFGSWNMTVNGKGIR